MILETPKDTKVTISEEMETGKFSISDESLGHIMNALSKLYSNPALAVIREYSTNAMDSHIKAGKKNTPIEVTLPNRFDPALVIKDTGVGMTHDEVMSKYVSYGFSSKTNSNDFNGQLGFGCKSAFSIARQFSVRAVKDGICNAYSMYKDSDNQASVTCLDSFETEEPNGVTVTIPVEITPEFAVMAKDFYQHMNFPVILDGNLVEGPEVLHTLAIGDYTFSFTHNSHWTRTNSVLSSDLYIRMGGVMYPVKEEHDFHKSTRIHGNNRLIIDVPIGSVNFTPNREELLYDSKTNTFLSNLRSTIDEFFINSSAELQTLANSCNSLSEVVVKLQSIPNIYNHYLEQIGAYSVNFKGISINPNLVSVPAKKATRDSAGNYRIKDMEFYFSRFIPINMDDKLLIIATTNKTVSQKMRDFARITMAEKGKSSFVFVPPYESLTPEETYGTDVVYFDPKFKVSRKRPKDLPNIYNVSFPAYSPEATGLVPEDEDLTDKVLVVLPIIGHRKVSGYMPSGELKTAIVEYIKEKGYRVIGLKADISKLTAYGYTVMTLPQVVIEYANTHYDIVEQSNYHFLCYNHSTLLRTLRLLADSDIKNDSLKKLVDFVKSYKAMKFSTFELDTALHHAKGYERLKPTPEIFSAVEEVYTNFPLLRLFNEGHINQVNKDAILSYVNVMEDNTNGQN